MGVNRIGKEESSGPISVMFTDMVGSTELTQTRGDAVAQQIVRTHNRIVRDALTKYAGKEIKHTGDGIMASFPTTSNAVESAIFMQRVTGTHNAANPELPLNLKIGINAGEPIAEDDDLFGTTVQLAARIVDKAVKGEILVSEIVRGICAGKELRFSNRGAFEMKGFKSPVLSPCILGSPSLPPSADPLCQRHVNNWGCWSAVEGRAGTPWGAAGRVGPVVRPCGARAGR